MSSSRELKERMMSQIEDEDYADSLTKQMDITISNLTKKRETLQLKIQEYKDVKSSVLAQASEQPVMISLGAGYFVEKSNSEAIAYLDSTISRMNQVLSEITSNIDHANDTKKKFLLFNDFVKQNGSEEENKEKLNEEGLPYMDIQEEIDEDGNVINVSINDTPVDIKDSFEKNNLSSNNQAENSAGTSVEIAGMKHIQEKIKVEEDVIVVDSPKRSPAAGGETSKDLTTDIEEKNDVDSEEVDQIQELMEDMGLTTKPVTTTDIIDQDLLLDKIDQLEIGTDEKFQLKQIVVEEYNKLNESASDNQQQAPTLAIDKYDDLLQLELFADDLNNEQDVSYADDEEWDFEFDEDDDDEDEDLADELLYGNHPSGVLGASASEKTNALLWDQIRKLRNQQDNNVADVGKKKKSVRFAETLDIKEVENISESLKNPPPAPPKMSLFKQNRVVNKQSEDKIDEPVEEVIMEKTIIEHDFEAPKVSNNEAVSRDIVEKDNDESYVEVPKTMSRFKAARLGKTPISTPATSSQETPPSVSPVEEKIMENTIIERDIEPEVIVTHDIIEKEVKSETPEVSSKPISKFKASRIGKTMPNKSAAKIPIPTVVSTSNISLETNDEPADMEVKETQLDYSSLHQDMDTMAKAYILGMYDDDIMTEGPVVDKVEDFEILNKMIESMPSKEPVKKINKNKKISDIEFDENLDEIGMNEVGEEEEEEYFEDMEDTGPILADEILENEITFDEDDEDEILTSELNENYHRLRNKLILDQNGFKKSQQELEFEPIDEDGNPIKISRFRAARAKGGVFNGLK
ncbi:hypothetical protein JA1_001272 [Spathaspora sp. JA1]|nr:hypothetical protein JA1_001272 [Spathaspora sp. JA1]